MTTIVVNVPDYLAQLAREVAQRERVTVDQVVAAALASQFDASKTRPAVTAERKEEIREQHPRSYSKWEIREDDNLRRLFNSGATVQEIARKLQRRPGAVRSRLTRLKII